MKRGEPTNPEMVLHLSYVLSLEERAERAEEALGQALAAMEGIETARDPASLNVKRVAERIRVALEDKE